MKVTWLVDNHAAAGLMAEHGLSFWIETPAGNVLFDCGQGPALAHNASALQIPLASAHAIVLSHGHYDHTGGLLHALQQNATAPVYLHPHAFSARFSIRENQPRAIGMPQAVREQLAQASRTVQRVEQPVEILPRVHVTGPIPRRNSYEDPGGPFYLDERGLVPDMIPDDQAIWLDHPGGPVVILGCAHAGVVNTCAYVCELSGSKTIQALAGGMHLNAASAERLENTATALAQFHIQLFAPCHCTGDFAVHFLHDRFPGQVRQCAAGAGLQYGQERRVL